MRILVTGSAGFIAGYVVPELLEHGHEVVGIDNFSKYGPVARSYDSHPRYRFVEGDAKNVGLLKELLGDCDHLLAGAAMIGGISYFHELAYDLLAENERITSATFEAALWARANRRLQKITMMSSSMVYESATTFPSREGDELKMPPPRSSYGLQKLAGEFHCRAALKQHGLPYTILRPFNCVGIGERRALRASETMVGNMRMAMSHVVPDLAQRILLGQDPLKILGSGRQRRHYTYGGDLARGVRVALESPQALNEDFNLSTATGTTVLELAERLWRRLRPEREFRFESDKPFEFDVERREPDVEKARRLLGFSADTTLECMLDEVVPWIRANL